MFRKILIVEDLDSIVTGTLGMLEENMPESEIIKSQYCDDANLKMRKAEQDQNPFDLLITDLSFETDHRAVNLSSGEDLIKTIRMKNPNLPIIVYSVEDKPRRVKNLFEKHGINGYVLKGRNGLSNLLEAVKQIANGQNYKAPELVNSLNRKEVYEIDEYDVSLLSHLSRGFTQDQISNFFKKEKITPSSISSIEKRLNRLKLQLQAKTTIQLVANAKDMGLI